MLFGSVGVLGSSNNLHIVFTCLAIEAPHPAVIRLGYVNLYLVWGFKSEVLLVVLGENLDTQ